MPNPLDGANRTAAGERLATCREVVEPAAGRASIYYVPPLRDGLPTAGRPFKEIRIQAPPWRWQRPFWWTHVSVRTEIVQGVPQVLEPDSIVLVVDRDVGVELPDATPMYVPTGIPGVRTLLGQPSPEILIHRVQNAAQVPQGADDDFLFLAPAELADFPRSPRTLRVVAMPDESGGTMLHLRARGLAMQAFPPTQVMTEISVATIRLGYHTPRHQAAYFHRFRQKSDGSVLVEICADSRNIRPVEIQTPEAWAGLAETARLRGRGELSADMLAAFADWDIRLAWRSRPQVPRPGSDAALDDAASWLEVLRDPARSSGIRIRPMVPWVAQVTADTAIGFFPVLGDIIEVGELVLASSTGRDRWGQEVPTGELFLMGLGALVPLLPSTIRHLPRVVAGADRIRRLGLSADRLADLLRRVRPRLVAALARIRASDLASLGDALANARLVSRAVGLTGLRDSTLATLL